MTDRSARRLSLPILCSLVILTMLACNLPLYKLASQTVTPTTPPEPTITFTPPPPTSSIAHRIDVRVENGVGEFFDKQSSEKFTPRGVNYVYVPYENSIVTELLKVGVYDPQRTRQDFQKLASTGYNTVRVFIDHCNKGPGCIGAEDNNGLNPAYLDNLADMISAAKETGIYLLLTSNDLPDQGGYTEEANSQAGETFAGYRNAIFLTPPGVKATRRYWKDLLSGLIERQAPFDAVLGWELLNEEWLFNDQPPLSLTSGQVQTATGSYDMSDPNQKKQMVSETINYYISQVMAEIKLYDPTALVTMGFFAPEIVAPDWYVETTSLLFDSELDFFDFHAYPGGQTLKELVDAFGMTDYKVKPIVMGEYGAFRNKYPDIESAERSIARWQAESCQYGFDGWLYWTYYAAGSGVDDRTWGLVDESDRLFTMLAPATTADPCAVKAGKENLAFQKTALASAYQPDNLPANAVDENTDTVWNAGEDAPQAFEIDLGQPYSIEEVRLLVAQDPPGKTIHHLRGRKPDGTVVDLITFDQESKDGDWLVYTAEQPVEGIQFIVIDTETSPSWVAWKEIQVFGK